MDRGAWKATVHGVAKRQTWLKGLNTHIQMALTPLEALLSRFQPLRGSLTASWWAWVNWCFVWVSRLGKNDCLAPAQISFILVWSLSS